VVLSVQDLWRVYRSFTPSLRGCHKVVECDFSVDWVMPRKVSNLLGVGGENWAIACFEHMKVGSFVFDVVSLERVERKKL
jgi:hypothetical protein